MLQSDVDNENEIKIIFIKNYCNDKSVFAVDENDVSYESVDQIEKVLPVPSIIEKGKRIFYKF